MERYQAARKDALSRIKVADHIFTMTYPLVNDPKLLKLVLKNLYLAVENALSALLNYERKYKNIPPFNENFESMLLLAQPVFEKRGLSRGYINFLNEIKEIYQKQKESDVEFTRKGNFVFASRDYELSTVSTKEIKEYLAKAKLFIQEALGVVTENERHYGKR